MSREKKRLSVELQRVSALDGQALEHLMAQGESPVVNALVGWEYRGLNVGRVARLLGIQKFIKGFFRLPDEGVGGYNVRAQQNSPAAPWVALPTNEAPRRFGYYQVTSVAPTARDNAYPRALLLDYGRGDNGRLSPLSRLRDYLVRVTPGSDELLLGKAYLALGRLRVPVGYFLLERYQPADDSARES